jgi:prepilin-type processing-associated H-X9-DG protein
MVRSALRNLRGFTFLEAAVVGAVVVVAVAVLLPAVQKVRQASNRSHCANNLRTIGAGVTMFQMNRNAFPTSDCFGWGNWHVQPDPNVQPSWHVVILPYTGQEQLYQTFQASPSPYGFYSPGNPNDPTQNPTIAPIKKLPYGRCPADDWFPDSPFYSNYAASLGPQQVEQFCSAPHDPTPFAKYATPDVSFPGDPTWGYVTSHAFDNWGADPPLQGNRGVIIWSYGPRVLLTDVTDGLSKTLLAGEYFPKYDERYYSFDPDPSWSNNLALPTPRWGGWAGSAGGAHLGVSTIIPINWPINEGASCGYNNWGGMQPVGTDDTHAHDNFSVSNGFRSNHPGGANFLFCDGAVRFLSETIDHKLYQHLGCRNDGQSVPGF